MGLGVTQNKTYLNIREGKLVKRTPQGEEFFSFVEGHLVGIQKRDREFKGETVPYWYVNLQDPDGGEVFSLSIAYNSGVFKSLINALANAEDLGRIRIEVYQSGEFTKTVVYNNGQRLGWKYPQLPPIEEVKVGGRIIKDDSQRMEFIENLTREVISRIKHTEI